MLTLLTVCAAIIVVELGIIVVALALAFQQIQKTARAFEILAYRVDEGVNDLGTTLRSGVWQTVLSLASGWWGRRR